VNRTYEYVTISYNKVWIMKRNDEKISAEICFKRWTADCNIFWLSKHAELMAEI
jgi:hypothetical protein